MKILRRLLIIALSITLLAVACPLTMSMAETTDGDLFPTTNSEKLAILQKYAPRVWLAQDEEFMPSSLGWAFTYMERYQNANDGNRYWIRTKAALSSPSDYTLPVFAGNLQSAPTYAFWVAKNNNGNL